MRLCVFCALWQHQFPHSYNELIAPFFVSDDELKIPPGLDRDVAMVPSEKPIRPLPRGAALLMPCRLLAGFVRLKESGLRVCRVGANKP
jgi:hypothetical protein